MTTKTEAALWRLGAYLTLAMLAAFVVSTALAQTVSGTANLSWTLPATSTDGLPLTGNNALTAINVYIATAPIPDNVASAPTLALTGSTTTATHTLQVANGSTLYARVRACNAGGCSVLSNQATKLIQLSTVPGVPTSVTITLTIG